MEYHTVIKKNVNSFSWFVDSQGLPQSIVKEEK